MEDIRPKLTYIGHGQVFRYDIFGRKDTDTDLVETLQRLLQCDKNFGLFDVICKSCFRNRKNLARPLDRSFNTKPAGKHKNLPNSVNMWKDVANLNLVDCEHSCNLATITPVRACLIMSRKSTRCQDTDENLRPTMTCHITEGKSLLWQQLSVIFRYHGLVSIWS